MVMVGKQERVASCIIIALQTPSDHHDHTLSSYIGKNCNKHFEARVSNTKSRV